MRDLLNKLDLLEATLTPSQITKYPERIAAFLAHIRAGGLFYVDADGTEVILDPSEADRFEDMIASKTFTGRVMGKDLKGNEWALSSFAKTSEFGGASAKPGAGDDTSDLNKEGVLVKPGQIGITDKFIPASTLADEITGNTVLNSTAYGKAVIDIARALDNGMTPTLPQEFIKNTQIKKAIVDYAGEYLGVLALVNGRSKFKNISGFLDWLGGDLSKLVLNFPGASNNPLADSFAAIVNPTTDRQVNISSKGSGGGAAPSMGSLVIPESLRKKKASKTAVDLIDLCQNKSLPAPQSISQVFQAMNLFYERIPEKIPKKFHKFLPWSLSIINEVNDSLKNGTPMPKYAELFVGVKSRGEDGGKITYVTKLVVMEIVNSGALPEFQAAILEILGYNFIQQYTDIENKSGAMTFTTQWPAQLDGVVTLETKSGATDPTKGGFSFKLKPAGSKADDIPEPTADEVQKDTVAKVSNVTNAHVNIRPPGTPQREKKISSPREKR
jgi:hypothetical protein